MSECGSLDEVQRRIDKVDGRIVPLLAERLALAEMAARLKTERSQLVDPDRAEAAVLHVRHLAVEHGGDPDLIEKIYRAIIDACVMHEARTWPEAHGGG